MFLKRTFVLLEIFLYGISLFKLSKAVTPLFDWDLSTVTAAGANTYSAFNGSNFMRFYAQTNTPNNIANANSQGFIFEAIGADACTPANAVYNTGIVSMSAYIYITDLTSKQYIYCELEPEGTNYNRAFGFGINNGNAFVEINSGIPITTDAVQTVSAPLNYQTGWNMIGVFSDATGSQVYNVLPDATTSSSGVLTHSLQVFQGNYFIDYFRRGYQDQLYWREKNLDNGSPKLI